MIVNTDRSQGNIESVSILIPNTQNSAVAAFVIATESFVAYGTHRGDVTYVSNIDLLQPARTMDQFRQLLVLVMNKSNNFGAYKINIVLSAQTSMRDVLIALGFREPDGINNLWIYTQER